MDIWVKISESTWDPVTVKYPVHKKYIEAVVTQGEGESAYGEEHEIVFNLVDDGNLVNISCNGVISLYKADDEGIYSLIGGNLVVFEDGVGTFAFNDLKPGKYRGHLSIEHENYTFHQWVEFGDEEIEVDYIAFYDNSDLFTVVKADVKVNVTVDSITYGEYANVTINITTPIGEKLNETVELCVSGIDEYHVEIENGTATFTIPVLLDVGTYTVKVIFSEDANYAGTVVTKQVTVTKDVPAESAINVTVPENTTSPTFSIDLKDENATGYLLVDINGEHYYAPVVNGTASVTVPPLASGNYTANVTYTGDDKYAKVTKQVDVNVTSSATDNALDIPTTSETSSPTFSVNLPSDAGGYLEVIVDGKKYYAGVENGTASITVPGLSEGSHNVTVIYSGDDKYPKVSKDATVNVHIPVYKLKNNKNVAVIYSATASYKVLVTKDGKAVGAGQSVVFTFNGKTTTVKTDKNGYATLKLNTKVKAKKYTVTAKYNGVTVKNTVKVKHLIKAKNIKVKKSKKVNKIKVKTNKVNGKFLKGKKLTLKVKGKKIKAKINKKGVATFKIKKYVLKKLKAVKKIQIHHKLW
jgi:hypothetical protein